MTREGYAKRLDSFLALFPNFLDTEEGNTGIRKLQERIINKYFNKLKERL